jgi:hypothetical protein
MARSARNMSFEISASGPIAALIAVNFSAPFVPARPFLRRAHHQLAAELGVNARSSHSELGVAIHSLVTALLRAL